MKIILTNIICLLIGTSISAATLNCTFNIDAKKSKLTGSELKTKVKSFSFDTVKEVGKNISLGPYKLVIWDKDKFVNAKIIGGDFKKPLSLQYSLSQKVIRFNYGGDIDFQCLQNELTSAQKATGLTKDKDIGTFQENLKIQVASPITFRYFQTEEVQLMRTLFFQNGKVFTDSERMERKLPWCSLRIQLNRNEDTIVQKGEVFNPITFQKQENNSYFTTYSYSFVDFNKGKKMGEKLLYSPYMFSCNILRGMTYKLDTFKSIVGDYFSLQSNL